MKIERDEVRFMVPVRFIALPYEPSDTFDGTVTPSVANIKVWKGDGSVVSITNFIHGAENQSILILGDGTTTIKNNLNIKTNTGADKLLSANTVYRFTLIDSVWYEDE